MTGADQLHPTNVIYVQPESLENPPIVGKHRPVVDAKLASSLSSSFKQLGPKMQQSNPFCRMAAMAAILDS